jgi:hypothetical protein
VKQTVGFTLIWTGLATGGFAQAPADLMAPETKRVESHDVLVASYTIQGATPRQEALLRSQIQVMQPDVLPQRIIFVPHWKYLYAAKMYQLHVPTGMASLMFTHLASRSVFIDDDHYGNDDSLGHYMAHELGHLTANSADENNAEKAAKPYRRRLKDARLQPSSS